MTHVEDPVCVSEHCGLWDKTANSQRYHAYRRCVDDASRVLEKGKLIDVILVVDANV